MKHRKSLVFVALASLTLLLTVTACGGKFNKDKVKGKAAEEMSDANKNTLKALGNKDVKDLTESEQKTVTDILWDGMVKVKWVKASMQSCFLGAIAMNDGNKSQCDSDAEKCAEQFGDMTDDKAAEKIKGEEANIKAAIKQTLAQGTFKAEEITNAFAVLNQFGAVTDSLNCGATQAELQKVMTDFGNKHGGEAALEKMAKNFAKIMNSFERAFETKMGEKAHGDHAGHKHHRGHEKGDAIGGGK